MPFINSAMGMDQYLSGCVALPSTKYDEKTDTRVITPEHQLLRGLCKITHPYPTTSGPLIFFPLMHWHNFDMIHSCFIKINNEEAPDSGSKVYVSAKDLEGLDTDLQLVFSGTCNDQQEEIEFLNDIFETDCYSFTDQQYIDAWDDLKEFSNDVSQLIKHENDEKTHSFSNFYYEADW